MPKRLKVCKIKSIQKLKVNKSAPASRRIEMILIQINHKHLARDVNQKPSLKC